jgi:tetratricopeptide (TPR) repeat protein
MGPMNSEFSGSDSAELRRLASPEGANRTGDCPDENALMKLAIGTVEREEEQKLLTHVAACDACSTCLREMVNAANAVPAPEEEEIVAQLPSMQPLRQQAFARDLAIPRRRKFPAWAMAAAAGLLIVGAGLWYYPRDPIADGFRDHRPTEFRVDATPYGPYTAQRGAEQPRHFSLPENAPPQVAWRRDLLQRDFAPAITLLEAAAKADATSPVVNDLAVAYSMQADSHLPGPGYPRALELLDQAIHQEPRRPAPHWNRAIVLIRLERRLEARAELRQFLELETAPGWRAEALSRLGDL